ncbi:MAG: hypothetical protein WCE69_12485, partial [Aestuariivirga sp.]
MQRPVAVAGLGTGGKDANGLPALLRKSLSAHALFWLIVVTYFASFLALLQLRPDIAPLDFLVTASGFLLASVPVMLLSLVFMRVYHI